MKSELTLMQDKNAKTIQQTCSKFHYGQKTVTVAGTAEMLMIPTKRTLWILINAHTGNQGNVYVGDANVSSTTGYVLDANDEVLLWLDHSETNIWIDTGTNGEGVSYIAGYVQ